MYNNLQVQNFDISF